MPGRGGRPNRPQVQKNSIFPCQGTRFLKVLDIQVENHKKVPIVFIESYEIYETTNRNR
jgi:hypothetical protein